MCSKSEAVVAWPDSASQGSKRKPGARFPAFTGGRPELAAAAVHRVPFSADVLEVLCTGGSHTSITLSDGRCFAPEARGSS